MQVLFKRVVTGFRCQDLNCREKGVWYIETGLDFYHWCPKHTVRYMSDWDFWSRELAAGLTSREEAFDPLKPRRKRKPSRRARK